MSPDLNAGEGAGTRFRRLPTWPLIVPAAIALVSLGLFSPRDWAQYLDYVASRIGWALLAALVTVGAGSVAALFLAKRRRTSGIVAASMLISVVLHMVFFSFFGFMTITNTVTPFVVTEGKREISFGLPSLVESMVGEEVRARFMEAILPDRRSFDMEKSLPPDPAEVELAKAEPGLRPVEQPASELEKVPSGQASAPKTDVREAIVPPAAKQPEMIQAPAAMLKPAESGKEPAKQVSQTPREMKVVPAPDTAPEPSKEPGAASPSARVADAQRAPSVEKMEVAGAKPAGQKIEETMRTTAISEEVEGLALQAAAAKAQPKADGTAPKADIVRQLEVPRGEAAAPVDAPAPARQSREISAVPDKLAARSLVEADPARAGKRPADNAVREALDVPSALPLRGAPSAEERLAAPSSGPGGRPVPHTAVDVGGAALPQAAATVPAGEASAVSTGGRLELAAARSKAGVAGTELTVAERPTRAEGLSSGVVPEHRSLATESAPGRSVESRPTASVEDSQAPVDVAAAGVGNQGGTIVPGVVQAVRPNVGESGSGESRQGSHAAEMRVERAIGDDSASGAGDGLARVSATTAGRTAADTAGLAGGSGVEVDAGESRVTRTGRGLVGAEPAILSTMESRAPGDHGPVPVGAAAKAIEGRPAAIVGSAASGPSARAEMEVGRAAGRLVTDALPDSGEGAGFDTDSLMSSSSSKALARIDVEVSDSGGPRTGIVADISGAGTAEEPPRTLISAELSEVPVSVPEKAIYKLRSPERRKQFIEELGGSKQTEQAVELALVWLAGAQSDDGRWDVDGFKTLSACGGAGDRSDGDVALTGLAVLSYLGAGYTHVKGEHADTVRKAVNWLVVGQKEDGDLQRDGQMYGQAMAAAALCECYSMTGDKRLLRPVQRAVDFILKAQNPEAGWRYAPRKDNDTSVTGWQVLALKSAMIAGIEIPARHFQWVGQWLDKVRRGQEGGLYTYMQGHGATPTMTAEGWFCQLLMSEQTRTRGQAETVPYLMAHPPVWTTTRDGTVNLYYWYYATLALHMSGAPEFKAWNEALTKGLLPGQETKGPSAGSWDPVCQLGERGGRVYSTATAALCLEVYYRYLPFYRQK